MRRSKRIHGIAPGAGQSMNIRRAMGSSMTEQDILFLISNDKWMMGVLHIAEKLNLPDWVIGAGFVRNKVWDYLHGFENKEVLTNDIDLIYFDPSNSGEEIDKEYSRWLKELTDVNWEVVNQARTHLWHNRSPYKNTEEALSEWVETPTCVGVRLERDDTLTFFAPHGIDDLVNLIVRPSPNNSDIKAYKERQKKKDWKQKWPKLKILDID